MTASLAAPAQTVVVSPVPSTSTPNIADGTTNAITKVGNLIIVGGSFTGVSNRGDTTVIPRNHLLAFDATTGLVSTTFAPDPDKVVDTLLPGPTANTVYVGGLFQKIAGATHPYLELLDVNTGAVVPGFNPPALNGEVFSMVMYSTTQLIVGGIFTLAGTVKHGGLASFNPTTGALTSYMNIQLAGHHNYDGTTKTAMAGVGATAMSIRPSFSQMVVLGNFKTANSSDRDQILVLTMGTTSATIANWETNAGKDKCTSSAFDSWVRAVDYSPGGGYFVMVGTGGPHTGQHCDSAMEFSSTATGTGLQPTWVDYSGGDTFLSVVSTGAAIYVGGHFRWLNNTTGTDGAVAGAVGRASIAALDPTTGLPRAWNPGRNPRGYGANAMYVDATGGLYIGSDTDYIGDSDYKAGKIAYFPLAGGTAPDVGNGAALPSNLYTSGTLVTVPTILARVNVGGPTIAATDGPAWLGDTQTATPNRVVDGSISTWPNAPAHGAGATLPSYVPMAVFNSQRAYPASAQTDWQFSVPAGTTLNVNLFVAQRGFDNGTNAATPSQFQVVVNGVTQPTVFDTNVSPGYNTAGELPPISVTSPASQVVTIGFTNVNGAASVNAIELVRTGGTASTYGFGKRSFNGTTLGTLSTVGQTDKTPFTTAHGAFAAGNKLFYALPDNNIYMRTFDGGNLGDALYVNPYTDPKWDVVNTGSTTSPSTPTYAGIKPTFYAEIPFLKSMFYVNGKLYYTRSDSTHLYWRWFTPDSGVIGADKFTVPGTSSFTGASGVLLVQSSKIYFSKTDGKLYTLAWNGTTVSGTPTAVAGISGLNVAAAFLGP